MKDEVAADAASKHFESTTSGIDLGLRFAWDLKDQELWFGVEPVHIFVPVHAHRVKTWSNPSQADAQADGAKAKRYASTPSVVAALAFLSVTLKHSRQ